MAEIGPFRGAFEADDFDEVRQTYFNKIMRDGSWSCLPEGWHAPASPAAKSFRSLKVQTSDLERYALDENEMLGASKDSIVKFLGIWDDVVYRTDSVSLCPSVSAATLALLVALKKRGVEQIIFETPAYYATIDQCRSLEIDYIRIPTYRAEGFRVCDERLVQAFNGGRTSAIWLTQPRFGIGTDQSLEDILRIINLAPENTTIVVDEATDQHLPSKLAGLDSIDKPLIRVKGITKPFGLNGLRVSAILHPPQMRSDIMYALEVAGASLDRFSLESVIALSQNFDLVKAMLERVNTQVISLRKQCETICLGSQVTLSPITNGYFAAAYLEFDATVSGSNDSVRRQFLRECKKRRMPVVLARSTGFAEVQGFEAIRLNYLSEADNVKESIRNITEIARTMFN